MYWVAPMARIAQSLFAADEAVARSARLASHMVAAIPQRPKAPCIADKVELPGRQEVQCL